MLRSEVNSPYPSSGTRLRNELILFSSPFPRSVPLHRAADPPQARRNVPSQRQGGEPCLGARRQAKGTEPHRAPRHGSPPDELIPSLKASQTWSAEAQ
jgi:hypothetical protein